MSFLNGCCIRIPIVRNGKSVSLSPNKIGVFLFHRVPISHGHRKGLEHYSRNKCLSLFVLCVLCTLHFSRMRHHQGTRRVDAATAADRNQTRRDLLGGTEAPRTLRGRSVKDDWAPIFFDPPPFFSSPSHFF